MKKLALFFVSAMLLYLSSCVKQNFDTPPIKDIPVGTVYTITQLRQMYADSGAYQIKTDASVYAVVTMDEASGNIYKSAYVQDAGDAVNLHLQQSGGLSVGDSIRIYLKNVILSDYGGMFQLDNVNNDSSLVILDTQKYKTPKEVSLQDLLANKYQAQLIKLSDVQFAESDTGKMYSDPAAATNRALENCDGDQVDVRTSNYANFATAKVPSGRGSFIGVVGTFNGSPQLFIRSLSEVVMDSARCTSGGGGSAVTPVESVNEAFDNAANYTDIAINGWTNFMVVGNRAWQGKVFNTDKYAQTTGYNSGLSDMETWLITPPVINTGGDKVLSFRSAMAYWTHAAGNEPLSVLASTDFNGSNFASATWTVLHPALPDANATNYAWMSSGDISLANFVGNVSIAFKYKGSNTESTTIAIDDVVISSNGSGGGGGGGGTTGITSLDENFSSQTDYTDISLNGWLNEATIGSRKWQGKFFATNSNTYAQATSYKSTEENEMWLITPKIDLDGMTNPTLNFDNEMAYWNFDGLTVLISTDFDGSNIASATWTTLSPTLAGQNDANYEWVNSGDVDLSSYSGQAYIAFKYNGDDTKGETTSYIIDNVKIFSK